MPTNAEIKALIQKEVRQQRSHLVRNGLADILDDIIDNIGAGPGGTPNLGAVLGEGNDAGALQIKNVGAPTDPNDAATKDYVDNNAGGTPGIDDVLAIGQAITADRTIDATGHNLTYTANSHTFNAEGVVNLLVSFGSSNIRSKNNTGDGNEGALETEATDLDVSFNLDANFNDGVKRARIRAVADATTSTITHTADRHIFLGTDNVFADNAAAVTGGLAVGTHYRTGDALKIVHA